MVHVLRLLSVFQISVLSYFLVTDGGPSKPIQVAMLAAFLAMPLLYLWFSITSSPGAGLLATWLRRRRIEEQIRAERAETTLAELLASKAPGR